MPRTTSLKFHIMNIFHYLLLLSMVYTLTLIFFTYKKCIHENSKEQQALCLK